MKEIWKDIHGYVGKYQISSIGRLRSMGGSVVRKNGALYTFKSKVLIPRKDSGGYYGIDLYTEPLNGKSFRIHRLVAEAFIENVFNKSHVNHKNGIRIDNRIENLEWVTHQENILHGYRVLRKQKQIN